MCVKIVFVQVFYMDQIEIMNNEYCQFVFWVCDFIVCEKIYVGLEDDDDVGDYINYEDEYFDEGVFEFVEYDLFDCELNRMFFVLNWDCCLNYEDRDVVLLLVDMYYFQLECFYCRCEIDICKLMFCYQWIDFCEVVCCGCIDIVLNGYNNVGVFQVFNYWQLNMFQYLFMEDLQGQDKDMGMLNKKGQNNVICGYENCQ